jgi:hypothetical protein
MCKKKEQKLFKKENISKTTAEKGTRARHVRGKYHLQGGGILLLNLGHSGKKYLDTLSELIQMHIK